MLKLEKDCFIKIVDRLVHMGDETYKKIHNDEIVCSLFSLL